MDEIINKAESTNIVTNDNNIQIGDIDDLWNSFTNGKLDMDAKIKEIIDADSDMGSVNQLEDISKISSLVKDFNDGKKISGIYDRFPDSMKPALYKMAAKAASENGAMINRQVLNFVARATLEEIATEFNKNNISNEIDDLFRKLYDEIKGTIKDISKEGGNIFMSTIEDRKVAIDAAIEKAKAANDMASVEKFQEINKASYDSYHLTDFSEYCKTVKIKKFYLEKPSKIFDDFGYKFRDHKYPIDDISKCPELLETHGIDFNDALKLCIAFCLYCSNMKPENYNEYIFMYYFIRNIIILDRLNYNNDSYDTMDDKSKIYYDGFIANIKKCISNFK